MCGRMSDGDDRPEVEERVSVCFVSQAQRQSTGRDQSASFRRPPLIALEVRIMYNFGILFDFITLQKYAGLRGKRYIYTNRKNG